jgi:hypothetical protein
MQPAIMPLTIIDYVTIMKTEVNYSPNYGNDTVRLLCRFSKYHKNKPFKEISCNDIIEFLDSLRKQKHKIHCING